MRDESAWESNREKEVREEREREERERLRGVVRKMCETHDGQYFLRWLAHGAGVFDEVYPADHAAAAWREGQRSVGLQIVRLCAAVGRSAVLFEEDEGDG